MRKIVLQIHDKIKDAKNVILIPHQNADGDALGSVGALFDYLSAQNIQTRIFCLTPLNPRLSFLPHSEKLTTDKNIFSDKNIDYIIVVDSGDLEYAGVQNLIKDHPAEIINIDHHHTNKHFGSHNLVMATMSSTCEVLFHFLRHVRARFTNKIATALLTGIITDTDNFTNAATSHSAMAAAGELIRHGGNLNLINTHTVRNKSVNLLHLWGEVLNRLNKHPELEMVYTYITQTDLIKHEVSENDSEGIANFLNNLDEGKLSLILKETKDGKIKGSFRTTRDDTDVSALAKKMGGGGHKKAAGFSTEGTVQEVLQKIMAL